MSRKQKPQAQLAPQYNAALTEAKKVSPLEEKLQRQAGDVLDWAAKGDYRERPKGIFFNFADPAERRRQRQLAANTRGQGVSALGAGANPQLLAMNKQHLDDENERDMAGQFEQDVAQGVGKAAGLAGNLAQMDQSRRMGVLGATAGLYGAELSRPKQPSWWQQLLGGAGEAAASAGMAALGL